MKCQILLFRKNKKSIIKLSSVESAHGVVSVKQSKRKFILATCIRASAKALISTKSADFFSFFFRKILLYVLIRAPCQMSSHNIFFMDK